ncbi:hypothetical protein B0H14DRAFT_2577330 [Mycena olivaceomarginata]|nr:hypothetical protein B0H14DRAFT_2577330 [Mycena olivaceomarginata]
MSDGTENGWGSSRVNSGRKKKAVVASSAPTCIQDTGMCLRISTSSASSSVQPNTVQARRAVNNDAPTAGATGFFCSSSFTNSHKPLGTQVGQFLFGLIFNLTRTFSPLAPPSTVPVRPLSTSAAIVQLNKDLADAALDHSPASGELTFDESLGDEEGEEDDPDGHFWVHPIDPVFALKRAAVSGFAPTGLYLLPIFVWLPHFLPGRPDFIQVRMWYKAYLNGYNENPITRRGCGKSYQGSDPWIIRQLPEYAQRAFPACLSTRGGLDTAKLDVMKATFSGHFGADPFSKMFSKFKDPLGYAGYAPSRQYFKSMFTAWFSVYRTLIDHVMSSLPATIIKADHTYKIISVVYLGVNRINAAMYSIVNSDEEVRAYAFTLTQSFPPLHEVYERMQAELCHHGHPPTQLLYTDNPRAERKFHEMLMPRCARMFSTLF